MKIKTVVIDSLNGYQAAMPEENSLILHMHELLQYLNRRGAATFMTVAQHGLVGDMKSPVDVTYLADTVILLRYFEAWGRCAARSRSSRSAPARMNRRFANIASTAVASPSASRSTHFRACCAASRSTPAKAPLLEGKLVKPGALSERAVILAPIGRDGAVAAALSRGGYLR